MVLPGILVAHHGSSNWFWAGTGLNNCMSASLKDPSYVLGDYTVKGI